VDRPRYKTWVRTRPIVIFTILIVACLALSSLAFIWSPFLLVFLVPAAIFAYILLIVGLSRWRFSPSGGNYQDRVHQLLVARVEGDRLLTSAAGVRTCWPRSRVLVRQQSW
jgi:hypothetical protein